MILALLLAVGSAGAAALAEPSLIEETGGVLGRAEVMGEGAAEARARALVVEGRWPEAAEAWAAARREGAEPGLAAAWEVVSLARAERWDEARLVSLASLAAEAGALEQRLLFAWLMCEGGAERTARKVLRDLPLDGGQADAARVLALRSWRHQGRDGGVRRARRQALDGGGEVDAWFWLESSLGHFAAQEPQALDDLDRALRARGVSATHAEALVELRLALGDDAEALRAGLSGMERHPADPGIAGLTAIAAGRPEGTQALERAVAAEPERAAAREVRGALRLASGQPEGALEDLLAAGRGGRDSAAVVGMIGRALAGLGKPREAHAALRAGTERHPGDPALAAQRFEAARAVAEPELVVAAAEAWRAALATLADPLPDEVVELALAAAVEAGQPGATLSWAEVALAADPADPGALRQRAVALQRLGRGTEALAAFEAGLRAAPEDPSLLWAFAAFLAAPGAGVAPDPARARGLAVQAGGAPWLPSDDAALAEALRRRAEGAP
ncbi:hypothetical protein L6R53_31520 [Myxococcota bacterium]|nr:hypothetical protein [Myxococcota bacterium]